MARPKPPQHRSLQKWVVRHELVHEFTACRMCLDNYPNAAVLLPWRLRIITSCPEHGIMLEAVRIVEDTAQWRNDAVEAAPDLVRRLDSRTWQALTTGNVRLASGLVHAGLWFRLLRTIWDELNRPPQECYDQAVLSVLNGVDGFYRMTKDSWRLRSDRRHAICVASAIEMMEAGTVFPEGIDGKYFTGGRREMMNIANFHKEQKHLASG